MGSVPAQGQAGSQPPEMWGRPPTGRYALAIQSAQAQLLWKSQLWEPFWSPLPTRVLADFQLICMIFCLATWWRMNRSLLNKPMLKEPLSLEESMWSKEVKPKWDSMFQEPWACRISGIQDGRAGRGEEGSLCGLRKGESHPRLQIIQASPGHTSVLTGPTWPQCRRQSVTYEDFLGSEECIIIILVKPKNSKLRINN